MQLSKTQRLVLNGVIAATYAALTLAASALNLAYGPVQFRFSEALTILPFLFPGTWPGLFIGCLVANLLSPYGLVDIVCGSLATLLAALWTAKVKNKWIAPLPPVICNMVIIGASSPSTPCGWAWARPWCATSWGCSSSGSCPR